MGPRVRGITALVLLMAGLVAGAGAGPARAAQGVPVEATRLKVQARPPISSSKGQGLWLVTRPGDRLR
ncbi:MAG: hypothetical protein ABSE77_03570 [Acidimicrobiales bacterium]